MPEAFLDHFIEAHQAKYKDALSELKKGQKKTHWMWFIFPIVRVAIGFERQADLARAPWIFPGTSAVCGQRRHRPIVPAVVALPFATVVTKLKRPVGSYGPHSRCNVRCVFMWRLPTESPTSDISLA